MKRIFKYPEVLDVGLHVVHKEVGVVAFVPVQKCLLTVRQLEGKG